MMDFIRLVIAIALVATSFVFVMLSLGVVSMICDWLDRKTRK